MIEHAFYDLSPMEPLQRRVTPFTRDDDPRWAGVVELAPGDIFASRKSQRTDIFALAGTLTGEAGEQLSAGGFLSLRSAGILTAGSRGAALFVYREPNGKTADSISLAKKDRSWRAARIAGMRVADLVSGEYQLSLVEWSPGTQVARHDHPAGEEIFVLEGALHSQGRKYNAGSWLRLHPGATHTPCAEHSALIILRNGHLGADG